MDIKAAKQEIRQRWREIIPFYAVPAKDRVNGETSYICPFCGHGTHGDGLTRNPQSKDGNALKCFGCDFSGDIIDLIQKSTGGDFVPALREAAGAIGVTIDEYKPERTTAAEAFGGAAPTSQSRQQPEQPAQVPVDYTAFFLQAQKANTGEYLEGRGISKEIQDRFGVGFCAVWKSPNAPKFVTGEPYVIFPTSKGTYSTRYAGSEKKEKCKKMKVGKGAPFFCQDEALKADEPIFIVEGETDALSLWEINRAAISIGSTANAGKFAEFAAKNRERQYIIALDNDSAGEKAIKKITDTLTERGVKFLLSDISGRYKDPNERLQNDRQGLEKAARYAVLELTNLEQYKREKLNENNAAVQLTEFWEQVYYNRCKPVSTGFRELDKALDGGFFPEQLVFLGAISSLGKTTLLLQILDRIAAAGTPVLLFSLEMSRNEIIAKSISRGTFELCLKENKRTNNAKSMRGVLAGYRHTSYNSTEIDLINRASKEYHDTAGANLYIYEGRGDTGVEEIRQETRLFITLTGKKPIIFIDYLQILAPQDPRATDKQNTDTAVKLLKQLARDEQIAVVAISSLNRENYNVPISMTAFKESGAIEYSSDVLIGLQLAGTGTKDFKVNEAKRKDPREIELHILKNRNGAMPKPILYNYYPIFNYWCEVGIVDRESEKEPEQEGSTSKKTTKKRY